MTSPPPHGLLLLSDDPQTHRLAGFFWAGASWKCRGFPQVLSRKTELLGMKAGT